MQSELFLSKRGKIHTGLIGASVLLVGAGLYLLTAAPGVGVLAKFGWGLLLVATAGGMLWALVCTRYEVADDSLVLRCGPFHNRIPLEDIGEVARVRSWASSYALAEERLRVVLVDTKGCIDVSPRDEAGFLSAIAARRGDLVPTAEGLFPERSAAVGS